MKELDKLMLEKLVKQYQEYVEDVGEDEAISFSELPLLKEEEASYC